jgi:hypothetical protein
MSNRRAPAADHLRTSLLLLLVLLFTPAIHAQGCAQCNDQIAQTPARTQSAYRKAILVLVFAGTGVFTAAVVLMRRLR